MVKFGFIGGQPDLDSRCIQTQAAVEFRDRRMREHSRNTRSMTSSKQAKDMRMTHSILELVMSALRGSSGLQTTAEIDADLVIPAEKPVR